MTFPTVIDRQEGGYCGEGANSEELSLYCVCLRILGWLTRLEVFKRSVLMEYEDVCGLDSSVELD